jgi:glyoxylase-like metal-dependent hydrolase (beta-lactamase superfamily II)
VKTLTGAEIYAGKDDCAVLRAGRPREAIFSTLDMESHRSHPIDIDIELEGGEVLAFGDTKIMVVATPGHSPGSVCYLLERNNLRVLFTGDTISSFVDDLGTYAAYLAPRYRGNAEDYLQSLRKLKSLPEPDLVLPGHPTSPLAPRSPRLSHSEWHRLLDRGIHDMEQLVTRHRADGTDFLDGTPKQLLDGFYYLGDHKQYPVYAIVERQHVVLFDAPGSSGIVEFVRQQLQSAGVASTPTCVLLTSCDPDAIAGLRSLVKACSCSVVAAAIEHNRIRQLCPPGTNVMSPEELQSADWLPVRAIPLAGRGLGPIAYSITWKEKSVLVSGKFPIFVTDASASELANDLRAPTGSGGDYLNSLKQLRAISPDLWLPSVVIYGQNANLYDHQWTNMIDQNRQLIGNTR